MVADLGRKIHCGSKLKMSDSLFSRMLRKRAMKWPKLFSSLRTKILLGYVLLMVFSTLTSTFAIRHLLYVHLRERIAKDLERAVGGFEKHVQETSFSTFRSSLFKNFVNRDVVKDKYYFFFADGEVYQTSDRKIVSAVDLGGARLDRWSKVSKPEDGKITLESAGKDNIYIYYLAVPVPLGAGRQGVFVALLDATWECQEISDATFIIIFVMISTLSITLLIVSIATKRMLRPLRLLTRMTHSINYDDLTQRIPVQGNDEISDLTVTFNGMIERLQVFFNTQKEFFNHAGHELKTPLTIIRVNLELLSDDPIEQQQTIELVTDELDRMGRYVDDMILLSKAEQPDFLILETVNLSDLTREVFTKATALGERNWQLEKVGEGTIVGDRHRLTQVFMNLAQNASQQTSAGAEIHIGSIQQDGIVRFWVRDNGPGIDPRVHKMIFERFIRCPDARKRFEGMGLGLAIVKKIVEAHEGHIELVSNIDIGSTFTVVIPIASPPKVLDNIR
jgi:signal transduction histidine kinase